MYAIIQEGGGQRWVEEGDILLVDLLDEGLASAGKTVTFDKVMAVGPGDGSAPAKLGLPFVAGASVTAEVIEGDVKGEKIHIVKFRRRKGYRRKTGHRQRFTKVKITKIAG